MITDTMTLTSWNGALYCKVRMPDGTSCELKGDGKMSWDQWQALAEAAWVASQEKPPEEPVLLDAATKEQLLAECKERGITTKDIEAEAVGVKL